MDPIVVTVVRTESVLAAVAVEYYIEPNGDAKFYGGASVIYFLPGEAVRHVTVIAKDDGVPQVSCAVSIPSVSPHSSLIYVEVKQLVLPCWTSSPVELKLIGM